MGTPTRRQRAPTLIVVALAALMTIPAATAQLGTSARIDADSAPNADVDLDLNPDTASDDAPQAIAGPVDDMVQHPTSLRESRGHEPLRLHTRINANTVESLVAQAIEVPEVRKLLPGRAALEVIVDTTHYRVDIHSGDVLSVNRTDRVPEPDYIIRAGNDAARSLANAADPAYTAITLLKGHFLTIEAAKLTHQAALKAFLTGSLDKQLDVRSSLQPVTIDRPTAAQTAILDAGLHIVRHGDRIYAANHLGGLIAALHAGNPALSDPPAELDIQLSGIAGGLTIDYAELANDYITSATHEAIRAALEPASRAPGPELELDPTRVSRLAEAGTPHAFLAGLGATHAAKAALAEDHE